MNILFSYIATLVSLVALDALWILVLAKKFYATQMGFLFSKSINLVPVAFFYPLYAFGILALVVLPATSWVEVLWRGGLLGLVAYSAYDLTNHATISGWPLSMTLVDIAWGTVVTALVSVLVYFFIALIK